MFKGTGWYVTDYSQKMKSSEDKKPQGEKKKEPAEGKKSEPAAAPPKSEGSSKKE
jgi:predicted nucleic acid-binding Zn ribbon protein